MTEQQVDEMPFNKEKLVLGDFINSLLVNAQVNEMV
jgi:hypothetical protein